jgi:hypothetical protein
MPAGGTPVEMSYTATCSPAAGNAYALRVTLAQRTGRTVTTATAEARRSCTGRPQAVVLRAGPATPGTTFRPGRVSVTACLRVHDLLHRAGRTAWNAGDPVCTGTTHTTIVAVAGPAGRGQGPIDRTGTALGHAAAGLRLGQLT